MRDLLKQLDYHPLAIQLVLPALHETSLSLAKIKADFASLMPKFVDDTETGRNRSLLASLDFSLRRLSEEQRALLPRMALFEGGASEDDLLAITEIPESEWVKLRPALEQAALITAEQVHENVVAPFLRFHPVLAPYLRSLKGADDEALRERYAKRYYELARYLYREDTRNPQAVRALVWLELPNLRRALELLLDAGELDDASGMATIIAKFPNNFGLIRELNELRHRVDKAVVAANRQNDGKLTMAEFQRESGKGGDEYRKGDLHTAFARFMELLTRIEASQEDTLLGRGSYEHSYVLYYLARCLKDGGRLVAAEVRQREALSIIEALIKQQPEVQVNIRHRGGILVHLGDILRTQGRYFQAKEVYEESLKDYKQIDDLRNQAIALGQLGNLALMQQNYDEARSQYMATLKTFRELGETAELAGYLRNLGIVAQKQEEWAEAEQYYRESLAFFERQDNLIQAAGTCNQLASVAWSSDRPAEAEGWYKRALELISKVNPGGLNQAMYFSNLAELLVSEVHHGRVDRVRLAEARSSAEQALAIKETLDASSEIWKTLGILANIADLESRTEEARNYRHRERETFAAFEGNRYHIDRQHGQLITDIAAAAKGNEQAHAKVEETLPQLEAKGWHVAGATHRIWAGERDWHSLVDGLDAQDALLILRVLETIEQPVEAQDITPKQVFASLPEAIREAMEKGDQAALQQAFDVLSPEEQQTVVNAIQYLQSQQEEDDDEEE